MVIRDRLRRCALVSLLVLAPSLAGCYGQFALTRKIYSWNGRATNNKVANSAITWALIVVPVYAVLGMVDFVVLNTIEFWTGENPVSYDDGGWLKLDRDGHRYVYQPEADGRVLVLRDGTPAFRYQRQGDRVLVSALDGSPLRVIEAR